MKVIAAALLVVTASAAHAQSIDLTGHWKGTVDIPNQPMEYEVDLGKDTNGNLIGAVTAGIERSAFPLLKIGANGRHVVFFARADQPFEGDVSENGQLISGSATLSGYTLPFSMARTGRERIDPPPASHAVGKELEGTWKGVLAAAGRDFHFVMNIENRPDGTAIGRQISVDEGGLMLYVVVTQDAHTVKIEAPAISASFTGELNAAATDIVGTWTQRGASLPLTIMRANSEGAR